MAGRYWKNHQFVPYVAHMFEAPSLTPCPPPQAPVDSRGPEEAKSSKASCHWFPFSMAWVGLGFRAEGSKSLGFME